MRGTTPRSTTSGNRFQTKAQRTAADFTAFANQQSNMDRCTRKILHQLQSSKKKWIAHAGRRSTVCCSTAPVEPFEILLSCIGDAENFGSSKCETCAGRTHQKKELTSPSSGQMKKLSEMLRDEKKKEDRFTHRVEEKERETHMRAAAVKTMESRLDALSPMALPRRARQAQNLLISRVQMPMTWHSTEAEQAEMFLILQRTPNLRRLPDTSRRLPDTVPSSFIGRLIQRSSVSSCK